MSVDDKAFEPDINFLKNRLCHWFRFDSLPPEQGITLLLGVEAYETSILVDWGTKRGDTPLFIALGLSFLNGDGIRTKQSPEHGEEETEKAKKRIRDLATRHRKFLDYWKSGQHPEFPTPLYFVEWAKLKGLSPAWMPVAVELGLIPGEPLIEASLNATSARPEKPMATPSPNHDEPLPTEGAVSINLPYVPKKLAAVFQIMRDNWTDYDPKRPPKQVNIAIEIDDALGWKGQSDGPSRNAKAIAMLIKPDAIDDAE